MKTLLLKLLIPVALGLLEQYVPEIVQAVKDAFEAFMSDDREKDHEARRNYVDPIIRETWQRIFEEMPHKNIVVAVREIVLACVKMGVK